MEPLDTCPVSLQFQHFIIEAPTVLGDLQFDVSYQRKMEGNCVLAQKYLSRFLYRSVTAYSTESDCINLASCQVQILARNCHGFSLAEGRREFPSKYLIRRTQLSITVSINIIELRKCSVRCASLFYKTVEPNLQNWF